MFSYPNWLEVDLGAVAHNTRAVLSRLTVPLMAVVKANAYGLGAVEIARTALAEGAVWLAVARVGEAQHLRQAGITAPILVFGMATPSETDWAIHNDVSLTLYSLSQIDTISTRAANQQHPARVHLKIDTGFGRLGVLPADALAISQRLLQNRWIELEGIYTHLAFADEIPDHPVTAGQLDHFRLVIAQLAQADIHPRWIHASNSAVAFGLPEAHFNLVRAGTALLGAKPFYFLPLPSDLKRVVTWKCQLASCKHLPAGWGIGYGHEYVTFTEEWIGVLPVGYGDGFRRTSNNEVLIGGERVPVVGRVCSDLCMVRLPHEFPLESEAVLLGEQGEQAIYIEDLVKRWKTSQADIISNINTRVPRVYIP